MSSLRASGQEKTYRFDIDGLRALAILPVVLFHAGVRWLPGGFSGVDIFFAISGYLIGGHIYGDLERGTFRYVDFYRRRAKRILPALFAMLSVLLLVCGWLLSPYELREVGKSAAATAASVSNILFSRGAGYFAARSEDNPLLMTWSLGVEEQFYLVAPLLMVWLVRMRSRLVLPAIGLLMAVSFGLACYQLRSNPMAAFYLLPSRAWELAGGVGLAIAEARARKLPLHGRGWFTEVLGGTGLLLLLGPFWLLRSTTPFPGPAALPSVAGCLLLLAARGSWINRKLLSLKAPAFAGRISYSWYLWHWPLLALLRVLRGQVLPLGWGLAAIAAAFGLAVLSFYFVETPFRFSRLAAVPLLIRYGTISCLFVMAGMVIWKTDGLPGRYPTVARMDLEKLREERNDCLAGRGEAAPRSDAKCTQDGSSQRQVALWGDSHAAALAPALREAVARSGYELQVYAKTTCPPLTGAAPAYPDDPDHVAECAAFNERVLQRLAKDSRVEVVALQAFWESSLSADNLRTTDALGPGAVERKQSSEQLFRVSLEHTVDDLQHAGKRVVLFGDVPTFRVDPLWRMRSRQIGVRNHLLEILQYNMAQVNRGTDEPDDAVVERQAQQMLEETAAGRPGVGYWDMRQQLCGAQSVCAFAEGETLLYIDTNHITLEGGRVALSGWTLAHAAPL